MEFQLEVWSAAVGKIDGGGFSLQDDACILFSLYKGRELKNLGKMFKEPPHVVTT